MDLEDMLLEISQTDTEGHVLFEPTHVRSVEDSDPQRQREKGGAGAGAG